MKNLVNRSSAFLAVAALASTLWSCRSAPQPDVFAAPPLDYEILHFAGTLFTGPSPAAVDASALTPETAFDISCRISFVDSMPSDALDTLGARAVIVFDSRGTDPLRVYSPLAAGARVGSGEAASEALAAALETAGTKSLELADLRAVCTSGVTAVFVVGSEERVNDPVEGPTRRSIILMVSRDDADADAPVQVALLIQHRPSEEGGGEAQKPVSRQMILLQDRPSLGGAPLALFIPSPFPETLGAGFVADIRVMPPSDDPAHVDRVRQVAMNLAETTAAAKRLDDELSDHAIQERAMQQGLAALDIARIRRPAVIFLAGGSDGILSLDLALSSDDDFLTAWIDDLKSRIPATTDDGPAPGIAELNWRLEQSGWRTALQRDIADRLSPGIRGLLLRRAGEAARYPDLLLTAVNAATSPADLLDRLATMNREFLDDNDVASRARAHDWLRSRGLAVPGYDPFASRAERRATLERAEEAQAAQSEGAGS